MNYELCTINAPANSTLYTMNYELSPRRAALKTCLSVSLSKKLHIYAKTPPKNAQNSVEIFHRFREKKW